MDQVAQNWGLKPPSPSPCTDSLCSHPALQILLVHLVSFKQCLYFPQLLAVVYGTFTNIEKKKFKRLFLHKRLGQPDHLVSLVCLVLHQYCEVVDLSDGQ